MASGRRILVVEDNPEIGEMITAVLGQEGYLVTLVQSEAAAVAALAAGRYDLVLADTLADLTLGERRWAAVERIRAAAHRTPIIICTAHNPSHFAEFAARGFSGLIAKPFDLDDLLRPIARLLVTR